MELVDDRTDEQKKTHYWLIIGTDRFMSGWGGAEGGASYAVWACRPEDRVKVENWVESRSDMMRVRSVSDWGAVYRPSRYCVHCHIYVVDEKHRALQ